MIIHTLDLLFLDTPGLIAAYLLECGGGELALVETGPGSTLGRLREAVRETGFAEDQVKHVFVTHIHLDHAGAAGWWAGQGAQIYCHPNAAKHLVDPSRLIESAKLVYGDQMDRLWGDMLPAPAERVTTLVDGQKVRVGEVEITAWDTPGHARHHHAFSAGGACFTGDVAGLRLEGSSYLSVTAAPPQFDPPAYVASINRLKAARFERLFLTHFGEVTDVEEHLTSYAERVQEVHANVRRWRSAGAGPGEIRKLYSGSERQSAFESGVSEELWRRCEMANATTMCADGVALYVEKNG